MCGLCGFGLTDAEMVLGLEDSAPVSESFESDTPDVVVYQPNAMATVKHCDVERDDLNRSLHSVIAQAAAIVWSRRVGKHRPAIGL